MFVNTQYFREAAIHFEKHGRYADGEYDSYECIEYWNREHIRVQNGYEVGGVKITGRHYLYLNYLPILLNTPKDVDDARHFGNELFKIKRKAKRGSAFADFWDEDYILFWTWEIAKEGVGGRTEEEMYANFDKIDQHLSIPLVKNIYNLSGGKNHLYLKPRGVGASWKGAVLPIYNQFFVTHSNTYLLAHEETYLLEDGIFSKYLHFKDTLMGIHPKHSEYNPMYRAAGFRRAFSKQDITDMTFRAAVTEMQDINGQKQKVEVGGKRSSVIGMSTNGNPSKARGKRGDFVYEEFGSFPQVAATWLINQQGVEQEGLVYGTQYGFGTGGDEKSNNIEDLTKMFYDPKTYNILEYNNIYDQALFGLPCAHFTPAYRSLTYKDKDGNSNEELAKQYLDHEESIKEKGADPTAIIKFKAEKPRNPADALQSVKGNIFPVKDIIAHRAFLTTSKLHIDMITTGRLDYDQNGYPVFDKTNEPIFDKYPIEGNTIYDTPVHIVHPPRKNAWGRVPRYMYRICVDPYRHDSTTGDSIGSCYVIENANNLSAYGGDRIVAWYNARPQEQEDFNKVIYMLAEYYNCKIGFENDEPGDIVGYAKRKKKLHCLEEQFELAYDERTATKRTSRKVYGMHIASGALDLRKLQGDKYIQSTLSRKAGVFADGRPKLWLHNIYDIGLLRELEKYPNGNFDRISALRIGVYYEKELAYKEKFAEHEVQKVKDDFFTRDLFV